MSGLFPSCGAPKRGEVSDLELLVIRHGEQAISNLKRPEYHMTVEAYEAALQPTSPSSREWGLSQFSDISLIDDDAILDDHSCPSDDDWWASSDEEKLSLDQMLAASRDNDQSSAASSPLPKRRRRSKLVVMSSDDDDDEHSS